jgi:hypothetical protein
VTVTTHARRNSPLAEAGVGLPAREAAGAARLLRADRPVFGWEPLVARRAAPIDAALARARGGIERQPRRLVTEGRNPP